jgi:putative SOS response-associated peptidase YedK
MITELLKCYPLTVSNPSRPPAGEWVRELRHRANGAERLVAELHNRMPAVLGRKTWPSWLGEEPADARQLKAMLAPYPSDEMTCWPIGTRVSCVKNKDPSLIEPIAVQ